VSLDLQVGAVFAGRYRILRRIAAGGMGAVYEALHIETDRRRALKVMLPHLFQSDEMRERFKLEAKVAAHVESEFIVEVFDAGVDEETQTPFMVMELLRGEELGKRVKRLGALPPAEVITYLHQTALALDKTHRASIVHRDLKPANLFLTEREEGSPVVKVLDFGVAKIVAEASSADMTQGVGTPLYMAPEQFQPRARLTGAADVYALGMVAYTLLVGRAYWAEEARENVYALARVAVLGPREPPSTRAVKRGVSLPPAFDAWFARITAPDPAARFPSATEAVRALADAFGLAPPLRASQTAPGDVSVSTPSPQVTTAALDATPAPGPTRPSRARRLAAGAGAVALLGAGATAAALFMSSPPAPSAPAAGPTVSPPATATAVPPPTAPPLVAPAPPASVSASAAPPPPAKPTARPRAAATVPLYSRE
jgi:eukaryotic-like serine/threonine-protein kinase